MNVLLEQGEPVKWTPSEVPWHFYSEDHENSFDLQKVPQRKISGVVVLEKVESSAIFVVFQKNKLH